MSSNSIDKNIANALTVIYRTYESVQKLISCLLILAGEKSNYSCCNEKERAMCWNKEEKNAFSWANHSFILVFQSENDAELKSGWRDGPLYIVDINLCDNDGAIVEIARFEYNDVNCLPDRLSTSDHWRIHNPLAHHTIDFISYKYKEDGNSYEGIVNDKALADKNYWGLRRVVGHFVSLSEITSENAYEIVFGGFDKLSEEQDVM